MAYHRIKKQRRPQLWQAATVNILAKLGVAESVGTLESDGAYAVNVWRIGRRVEHRAARTSFFPSCDCLVSRILRFAMWGTVRYRS